MTIGMGFPMGMRIPWESHGNGNKTPTWEWEGVAMNADRNGNGMNPIPMGKIPTVFVPL